MSTAPLKSILLAGASGHLGAFILTALLAEPALFSVTVLTRASSTSTFPAGVPVRAVPDDFPPAELATAMRGQDAVIFALRRTPTGHQELQRRFVDAALAAGVRRYITSDFGLDNLHAEYRAFIPMMDESGRFLDELAGREKELGALSWTAIGTGIWIDWALKHNLLSIDLKGRTAKLYDRGTHKFAVMTMDNVGRAVARVLAHPEETANKHVYFRDLLVSQRDIVDSLERQTGAKWETENVDSAPEAAKARKSVDEGVYFGNFALLLLAVAGNIQPSVGTGFEGREIANEKLGGLPKKELDALVKEALDRLN